MSQLTTMNTSTESITEVPSTQPLVCNDLNGKMDVEFDTLQRYMDYFEDQMNQVAMFHNVCTTFDDEWDRVREFGEFIALKKMFLEEEGKAKALLPKHGASEIILYVAKQLP